MKELWGRGGCDVQDRPCTPESRDYGYLHKASQNFSVDGEEAHEAPPLAEKLLDGDRVIFLQ